MPIFGSAGREEDGGATASSVWRGRGGDRMEPALAPLFPGAPSPPGPQPQAAHVTHGHSSQHVPVRV